MQRLSEPIPNPLTVLCVIFSLALMSAAAYGADTSIENIAGTACRTGVHQQTKGPFAVFVFCDDAEGTNIAVFYSELGDPRFEKWTLTRRFWQSEKWGADVQSIAWMPNRNLLVVATSEMYGTGAVYLLDLERQTAVTLAELQACESQIQSISDHAVSVAVSDCEHTTPSRMLVLPFPSTVRK